MSFELKEELKYAKSTSGLKLKQDGTIGITDYAQQELGDIVYIGFDEVKKTFQKGGNILPLESHKSMEFIKDPADGKVLEAHEDLEDNLELVNEDPYGEGWIVKIEINDPAQTEDLMMLKGIVNTCRNRSGKRSRRIIQVLTFLKQNNQLGSLYLYTGLNHYFFYNLEKR